MKPDALISPFPESAAGLPDASRGSANAVTLEDEVVALFEQLRNPLLRYLLSLGLNTHDGEEVVQEAFLALFEHLRQGKPRHNLRGWIFRVGHNLGLKQRGRTWQHGLRAVEIDGRAEIHADPSPNPEEQLAAKDRQERLQAVLHALPEKDQWCLTLRAEGLRYREIAEVLGVSLGMVSLMLGRSLARLASADGR